MNDRQLGFILWAIGVVTPSLTGLFVLIVGILFILKGIAKDAP